MENNKFMDQLDKIFENPQNVNMAQLETLLFETLKFFDSVRERMTSTDPKEREKAMQDAVSMQERLNQITDSIYAKTGLTKEKAQQILSNPANFKPEDWEMMKNMEKELAHFQKDL
ncbi:MAG: hypothetical protein ACRDFB_02655 [Rhabdochlamydiaceae bacterium]